MLKVTSSAVMVLFRVLGHGGPNPGVLTLTAEAIRFVFSNVRMRIKRNNLREAKKNNKILINYLLVF